MQTRDLNSAYFEHNLEGQFSSNLSLYALQPGPRFVCFSSFMVLPYKPLSPHSNISGANSVLWTLLSPPISRNRNTPSVIQRTQFSLACWSIISRVTIATTPERCRLGLSSGIKSHSNSSSLRSNFPQYCQSPLQPKSWRPEPVWLRSFVEWCAQ